MLPPALQNLHDRRETLLTEYNAGHITSDDAMSTLAASSTQDANGALWTIAPEGHFLITTDPNIPPQPADPNDYVDPNTPQPPQPAFPAPFTNDLETSPQHTTNLPLIDPAIGQTFPAQETTTPAQNLPNNGTPTDTKPSIGARLLHYAQANKLFVGIIILALAIGGFVLINKNNDTDNPTDADNQMPQPTTNPVEVPEVTSEYPTSSDTITAITILQTGTLEDIREIIADKDLSDKKAFRTQALWQGVAQLDAVITPAEATTNDENKIVQEWVITLESEDGDDPIATTKVTWKATDDGWKFAKAPNM